MLGVPCARTRTRLSKAEEAAHRQRSLRIWQLSQSTTGEALYRISGVLRLSSPHGGRTGQCLGAVGEACPGRDAVFFLSSLLSLRLANRVALRLGSLVRWQGRRNSIPLWRRASLPTGHGARRRRVGEPQQSKRLAANMSCVRMLAQRGWIMDYSTCRVQALLVPCRCLALAPTEGFW